MDNNRKKSKASDDIKPTNYEIVGSNSWSQTEMYGRMRETKYISSISVSGLGFIFKVNKYLFEDTSNGMNRLRTEIVSLKIDLQSDLNILDLENIVLWK